MAGATGRLIATALFGLAAGAGAVGLDPVRTMAGRYAERYLTIHSTGEEGAGDDVVEIVPIDRTHAFVRLTLSSSSERYGCTVAVVAKREGGSLVYRGPADDAYVHGRPCVLRIGRRGAKLGWDDGGSCMSECETSGLLRGEIPLASRRTIKDAASIVRSEDYRVALADWRDRR